MLYNNHLIINGKSTSGFPFFVAVEENAAPTKARKKDRVFSEEHTNGYLRRSIHAYEGVDKRYKFYLHDVDKKQLREFKAFIAPSGWFTPADEDDVKYYYEAVEVSFGVLDAVNGYECEVTFKCQPFALENNPETVQLGNLITNHTNAPMYPFIKITGRSSVETFLQIGSQRMTFKEIQDIIYIECRHGHQDVWASGMRKINGEVRGDFFEIMPGTHNVTKGSGIQSVEITLRWGWA